MSFFEKLGVDRTLGESRNLHATFIKARKAYSKLYQLPVFSQRDLLYPNSYVLQVRVRAQVMNVLQKILLSALGASLCTVVAHPVSAITLSIGGKAAGADGYKTTVKGATTIDFNGGTAPTSGFISYSGASPVVQGSVGGQYATPWEDSTSYLAVEPGKDTTMKFAKAADYFGLYWGSVDNYNHIDFYSGNALVKSFTGKDVSTTATGHWTGKSDNVYVDFFAGKGETFDKVVMRSDAPAFETDNHAYRLAQAKSVPEPGLMGGLATVALFGTTVLRKRQRA